MKIAYIATIRLPTERAHGYAILRTCLAWKKLGHEVTLYYPDRTRSTKEEIFAFYGLPSEIALVTVRTGDWIAKAGRLGPFAFLIQMTVFLVRMPKIQRDTVVFSRDTFIAGLYGLRGYRAFWNAHTWNGSRIARFLFPYLKGVVCISQGLESVIKRHTSIPTTVSRSGTDANQFAGVDKTRLRGELNLPVDATIAMYAGHLYSWKGADVVLKAAQIASDIQFVLIGGTSSEVARYREKIHADIPNVLLLGHKSKGLIPKYLASADVLLLPNLGTADISSTYTSPLKLFEYMASGVPIIASDLPSIREVVNDTTAVLVPAGDAASLARAVMDVTSEGANDSARKALELSRSYTWESQAALSAQFMDRMN